MHDRDSDRLREIMSLSNGQSQHLSAAGLRNYGDISPIVRPATSHVVETPSTSGTISAPATFNPALFQPQAQPHFALSPSFHQHHLLHSSPLGGARDLAPSSLPMQQGLLHGSPQSIYVNLPPRRSGDMGYTTLPPGTQAGMSSTTNSAFGSHDGEEGRGSGNSVESAMKKRKRSSLPLLPPPAESGSSGSSSSGFGTSAGHSKSASHVPLLRESTEDGIGQDGKKGKGKPSGSSPVINPGLTSCEACRKGKRRCEPSPLVPPSHPDAAKLPCARCRRFALECVRVKITRRKGPAPVDLSAISDAVHGYSGDGSAPSSSEPSTATAADAFGGQPARPQPKLPSRQSSGQSLQALPDPSSSRSASFTSPAFPLLAVSPSLSTTGLMPENLDHVVSGAVIDTIINLFFDYVYPLTPCLHRPTFVANLTARRDKTDPLFFALVLTVLASTLVQVPRSLINLDKTEIESLARRCVRVARVKVAYIYEGIVHLLLGNNTAHVVATAQANQLALAMRLNEEPSYEGLDPIESEMRRRIYWLLFQADKSTACLRARTICLRLEDAAVLRLPTEVDDEQITANGILPQPIGKTPLISGFNINTNLFRILNDALLLQRRRTTPTVDSVLADLQNVTGLREKVMQTTLEVADPLQLRTAYDSRVFSPSVDWESKLQERFLNYFQAPSESAHALNSFLVMQGNILVTQHLVRLVLLQTREDLLAQLALLTQMPVQGVGGMAGLQTAEAPEDIACELLDGLNSLPVECVATNGPSLVQKVRFVAIQLMECSTAASPTAARSQKLLMQFLSVLGMIEGMYTFGRDISAE